MFSKLKVHSSLDPSQIWASVLLKCKRLPPLQLCPTPYSLSSLLPPCTFCWPQNSSGFQNPSLRFVHRCACMRNTSTHAQKCLGGWAEPHVAAPASSPDPGRTVLTHHCPRCGPGAACHATATLSCHNLVQQHSANSSLLRSVTQSHNCSRKLWLPKQYAQATIILASPSSPSRIATTVVLSTLYLETPATLGSTTSAVFLS